MASSRQNSSQMLNSQSSSSTNSSHGKDKSAKVDANKKHAPKSTNVDKNLLLLDKSSSSSSSAHIPMSSNTIINSMNNMSKRKGTSFQITSVSVSSAGNAQQQQRAGAENNNDYETPSFSEDTFSREDVFFAQPNAFGTAPVIPTSSQYGLAIVGPDLGGNGTNMTDVHVSVTDAGINIMGQIPNKQDVDHKNERFKVVKIESTEPFKRGRWMCMDYLDHTALQGQDDGIDGSPKEDGEENLPRTKDSGLESGLDSDINLDNGDMEHMNDNDGFDQEVMRAEMMNHHGESTNPNASHEHHTMTSISVHTQSPLVGQQIHAQSMPQGHIQQIISHENPLSTNKEHPSSETLPLQASQSTPFNVVAGHPETIQQHAQSMTPDLIQRSLQHDTQQQLHQGATLPANILMQNLGLDHHHHLHPQQSQFTNASNATSSPLPATNSEMGSGENESKPDTQTSQFQNQQVGTGDSKHQQQQPSNEPDQQLAGSASTNDNITNNNNSVSDNNNNEGTQNTPSPSSSAGLGTVAEGVASGEANASGNNAAATGADDGQSLNEDSERHFRQRHVNRSCYLPHQLVKVKVQDVGEKPKGSAVSTNLSGDGTETLFTNLLKTNFLDQPVSLDQNRLASIDIPSQNLILSDQFSQSTRFAAKNRVDCLPAGLAAAALNINLSSLGPLYSRARTNTSSSTRASRATSPSFGNSADNNSASGTSAVAIDNKIEQAMDLVKSHLMFAVREEVEVLKEKINELMDRINQLEVENTILKANASPDTLSQLTTAANIVVSPQAQVQTSPAQPQNSPALSKIGIDASVLQVSNVAGLGQIQTQPPSNPPSQNPTATS